MIAALDSVLAEIFLGLAKEASPHERGSLVRMLQEHPQSARRAVAEVVEIMMRAKCFRFNDVDWFFLRSCRPLLQLAQQHAAVTTLFSVAVRLDLADAQNDPLYDPTMQEVVNLRVAQVLGLIKQGPIPTP